MPDTPPPDHSLDSASESSSVAAFIERLRRSGLSIDRDGRFVHEGALVTHEGFRRALFRWLDRLPDGRYVLRLDEQRFAYVDVADTPLVAHGLRWEGDRALLALSDASEEPLDPASLTVDDAGVLRCQVRGGRLEARLGIAAAAALAERIEADEDATAAGDDAARPVLTLGGRRVRLAPRGRAG
jgi:hypothetical protein